MTSERGPARGRSRREGGRALAELERCAGSQFDPLVVEAFDEELASARRTDVAVA